MDLAAMVDDVVAPLVAAGIRATADPRDVNPPAVLVGEPTIRFNRLKGHTAVLDLIVVAPNTGRNQARQVLGPLVDQVTAVWPATYGFPHEWTNPNGGDPLPAYRLPIPVRVC